MSRITESRASVFGGVGVLDLLLIAVASVLGVYVVMTAYRKDSGPPLVGPHPNPNTKPTPKPTPPILEGDSYEKPDPSNTHNFAKWMERAQKICTHCQVTDNVCSDVCTNKRVIQMCTDLTGYGHYPRLPCAASDPQLNSYGMFRAEPYIGGQRYVT